MTTPTDPIQSGSIPPIQPGGPQQTPRSYLDPTGTWSKFLTGGGQVATPQEVQMFMQGMLKMFNVVIQQQQAAYQRANQKLRKAEEGNED
jgi:hypothetical protein